MTVTTATPANTATATPANTATNTARAANIATDTTFQVGEYA